MRPPISPDLPSLDRLAAATRDLARFSRSAAGLGSVLGGAFGLISYLAHGLLPLRPADRIVLAALPFLWIAAKELLRRRFYQRLGRVDEPLPDKERRAHRNYTLFIAGVAALVLLSVLPRTHTLPQIAYAVIVFLMPFLTWFFLRSSHEFIVGIFLICQAAVGIAGHRYSLTDFYTLPWPVVSVTMIATGLHEHRRFLAARRTLKALQPDLCPDPGRYASE